MSSDSYPIQVAWSNEPGEVFSHYIKPDHIHDWTDWAQSAEDIHHISREFLSKHGKHPCEVAELLNQALSGCTVYTDAADLDVMWADSLFKACDMVREFEVLDTLPVFKSLSPIYEMYELDARISTGPAHNAEYDVLYLIKLYQILLDPPHLSDSPNNVRSGEYIDPDTVLEQIEKDRKNGTLSRKVTTADPAYQASTSVPGALEQVWKDGTRKIGTFKDGEFFPFFPDFHDIPNFPERDQPEQQEREELFPDEDDEI